MKRWLAFALGLSAALAAGALLVLRGTAPAPREQIDARSRANLERVLEEAEREGSAR